MSEVLDEQVSFCGLDSHCQIYQTKRESTCDHLSDPGTDYTLGVYEVADDTYTAYNELPMSGTSVDAKSVTSFSSFTEGRCLANTMCQKNSWSNGECFQCDRFSTTRRENAYCNLPEVSISLADLQELTDDGYLMGDVSTDGNNCACANYCFSKFFEGSAPNADFLYQYFQSAVSANAAYAIRNDACECAEVCDLTQCDTSGICGSGSTVFYQSVADLNDQQDLVGDLAFEYNIFF